MAHWYMDDKLFISRLKHDDFIKHIEKECGYSADLKSFKAKKRETFLGHYFSKYATPTLPPSWMVSEVISLGRWSYVFSCIKNREDQKAISRVFGVHYRILDSWMQSIVYLRNLCAHHNRIWNRIFVISPKKMKLLEQYFYYNTSFAAQATILNYLIKVITPDTHWGEKLIRFFRNSENINIKNMGFSFDWFEHDFWK